MTLLALTYILNMMARGFEPWPSNSKALLVQAACSQPVSFPKAFSKYVPHEPLGEKKKSILILSWNFVGCHVDPWIPVL